MGDTMSESRLWSTVNVKAHPSTRLWVRSHHMNTRTVSTGCRSFLMAVLVILGGLAIGTSSGQQGKLKEEAKTEKKVKFSMDGKPWQAIFEWIASETNKPVISNYRPTGSLTFVGPVNREY